MADTLQFVTFYLGKAMFGMDIRFIKEVYPNVDLCLVPRSEKYVRGLVNIRGQVVLVMDIAVFFRHEPRQITDSSQIIIMKIARELNSIPSMDVEYKSEAFGDKAVGFIVDQIGDVLTIDADKLEPPPSHLSESNAKYFQGVVRLNNNVLLVLDPGKFLEDSI